MSIQLNKQIETLSEFEKKELTQHLLQTTLNFLIDKKGADFLFDFNSVLSNLTNQKNGSINRIPEDCSKDIFEENPIYNKEIKAMSPKEKRARNKLKIKIKVPSKEELKKLRSNKD